MRFELVTSTLTPRYSRHHHKYHGNLHMEKKVYIYCSLQLHFAHKYICYAFYCRCMKVLVLLGASGGGKKIL